MEQQIFTESGIIADISIVSDDGVDSSERSHWKSTLESPISSHPPNNTSTPLLQSPTSSHAAPVPASTSSTSSTDVTNTSPYDADMSINL